MTWNFLYLFSQKGLTQLVGYWIAVSVLLDPVSAQSTIKWIIKPYTRPPGIGASPHPMGCLRGNGITPLVLEKNQNFASSWDVLRRYFLFIELFYFFLNIDIYHALT